MTLEDAKRLAAGLLPEVSSGAPADLAPRLGPVAAAGSRPREATVRLPRPGAFTMIVLRAE